MGKIGRLVLVLFAVVILSGCNSKKADIVIMDSLISDNHVSNYSNELIKDFGTIISDWSDEHPEFIVSERKQYNASELNSLGLLGANHLPDIFVTSITNAKSFYEEGLILDPSEYILDSSDGIHSFPVMSPTYVIVVYDPQKWRNGDLIFVANDGISGLVNLLSSTMVDDLDLEWLVHMISGDRQASFTDVLFLNSLDNISSSLLSESNVGSAETAIKRFTEEEIDAVLISGDDLYLLLDELKKHNQNLYERICFSSLDGDYVPVGYTYGLFLNSNLKKTPKKLNACLDLCKKLSNYEKLQTDDETVRRMWLYIESSTPTPLWSQYFNAAFWEQINDTELLGASILKTESKKIVAELQNKYEQFYLGVND